MIPNIVTSVRIVLAPFILIALSHNNFYLFFILMSIAAASDMLDGMLARMLNQRTVVGQLLDPLADKFLIDSLFLALYMRGSVPIWTVRNPISLKLKQNKRNGVSVLYPMNGIDNRCCLLSR